MRIRRFRSQPDPRKFVWLPAADAAEYQDRGEQYGDEIAHYLQEAAKGNGPR